MVFAPFADRCSTLLLSGSTADAGGLLLRKFSICPGTKISYMYPVRLSSIYHLPSDHPQTLFVEVSCDIGYDWRDYSSLLFC